MAVEMNVISPKHVGAYIAKLARMVPADRPKSVKKLLEEMAANIANAPTPVYEKDRQMWRLAGVIELSGIAKDADVEFFQSNAEGLKLRLPDPDLLTRSEQEVNALDQIGGGPRYVPPFYGDYLNKTPRAPTNTEFLFSRVADYVFSSCR
ncbi:hypothetical protein [Methylobrevis pamukkalensis]|uniref:Uncharacterized protein n=1 Tax=Methylobrevis pamukkalensis TaxID=1439726 RepID=A0A1E3H4K5_9HYPH|nr:hypothetical protein [Methylobrevis pamukkalensis]ODN70451.1 hypothetical protein A6302_02254 [Methylobrevis pamukkalensis]